MSLRDDLYNWNPMYLWQTISAPGGHVVTADEWNNYWNLMMTQGDNSSSAILNIRDLLFDTVWNDTDGATSIKFVNEEFTATDVGNIMLELAVRNAGTAAALLAHKSSGDHDTRYYTKTINDGLLETKAPINNPTFTGTVSGITKSMVGLSQVDNTADLDKPISDATQIALDLKTNNTQLAAHQNSGDHDNRYMLRGDAEMDPITIEVETFTILSADVGDGTFSYQDSLGATHYGALTAEGQVFELQNGDYSLGGNHIKAYINDTLVRSASSGGLIEVSGIAAEIRPKMTAGTEVTFEYYTVRSITSSGIYYGVTAPAIKYVGKFWIQP